MSLGHQARFFFGPLPIRVRVAALKPPAAQVARISPPYQPVPKVRTAAQGYQETSNIDTIAWACVDGYGWRVAKWDYRARNWFNV